MPDVIHLTARYRWSSRIGNRKRTPNIPITACREQGFPPSAQVSIYDNPANEPLITCQGCLDWLNTGDNRLTVTKGGMDEWIRRRVTSGDETIRYVDIPSGKTGVLTEDDLP